MTEQEIKAWLRLIGRTDADRIRSIRELLRHANEDRMSAEDRTICRQTLTRLEQGLSPNFRLQKLLVDNPAATAENGVSAPASFQHGSGRMTATGRG